ncbi:MEKK [Handroanthus impetiginosus]|uniref:MEKK n=1 Tax=Handroanthus impetiginosus TaxID=429701 RepID=A0A2G9G872_9LAMI|nr:MEKK [Handroanthus impetiginosus]
MAEQIKAVSPAASFDYELYEGDPDKLRTVDATPALPNSYIDPASLKLKYRIGYGVFGDVWLATHHQSAKDYDEYHEVAVKILHPIKEDRVYEFLRKFEELWMNLKSQQLQGVCWLHGISVISGKICIALRSYEGSIGDQMALLKGGKLPLPDFLRYGIELAKGIQQLHQIGVLVLNLKPTNFLIDEHDHVVLGDLGIPHLLLGIPWRDSHLAFRLGTPNYMAPEQWEPGVRGPISYETDSWGFACSMFEMLTGTPPWFGILVEEIHYAVVIRQEKPQVPSGLPPAVEDVLKGCFEYDLRNRPLTQDILQAFESSQNAVYNDGSWSGLGSNLYVDKSHYSGYSKWFLSKDHLQVGDTVRSRKALSLAVNEGVVVGLEKDTDRNGFALVQVPNLHNQLRVNIFALERVTSGFALGDWVHLN